MSVNLNATVEALSSGISVEPNLILEIDGLDTIYGARPILSQWFFDDGNFFDDGLYFDLPARDKNSKDYISLKGTTKNITQQIFIDRGASSSISSVTIELINKDIYVTKDIAKLDDILSTRATAYLSFQGASHPEDSIMIFRGIINDVKVFSGSVLLTIASGEDLKRQSIFTKQNYILTSAIDNTTTTIPCDKTTNFLLSQDSLLSYIRIDDEIMKVISSLSNSFTVVRGQLNTIATTHDNDTDISSFYTLTGTPIDLALKVMLSSKTNEPKSNVKVIPADFGLPSVNDIRFSYDDIERISGLVEGDTVIATGTTSNDGTYIVTGFGKDNEKSYISVDHDFTIEEDTNGSLAMKSQYAVLPDGLGMATDEVDVGGHHEITKFFGSGFPEYLFYLKDTVNAKEFINKEILFPSGLYAINRKARVSVKMTAPPLSSEKVPLLNETNILNISKLSQSRSTFKNMYNTIVYKYNDGALEDKFLSGDITLDETSENRIKAGIKQLVIESKGLRSNAETTSLITRQTRRFLDRYKFAAKLIKGVTVPYKTGFNIELGDTVELGGQSTKMIDLETGERELAVKLYEVINRDFNFIDGKVKLDLLETNFANDIDYAVVSMSSRTKSYNSNSVIIKTTDSVGEYVPERSKWERYVGNNVRLRSDDWTRNELVTITGLSQTNSNELFVSGINNSSHEDDFIEVTEYDAASDEFRTNFVFASPTVAITSVINSYTFIVSSPDATKFFVGSKCIIHSADYIRDSFAIDIEVVNISGNTITMNKSSGFTVHIGDFIDGIGFNSDSGNYYGAY